MARNTEVDLIVRAVAEGFKQISDDIQGVGEKTEEASKKSEKAGNRFTELKAKLDLARDAFATAGEVAQQAYEFISEGAQLDLARSQFDNLSESIGTTSDALLGRLKESTKGMISDAELVAGASDLINLGLARNEDQAVRLGTAVGALGLDLQVLGLTLANDSTARLDSLGLSMEDVKKKAAELQAQGFTGDAFDEAVLIGLEEKMELFGDASETTAGKLQRMEASATNLKVTLQALTVNALEPAITSAASLTGQVEEMADAADKNTPLSNMATVLNEINKAVGGIPADKLVQDLKDWERGSALANDELKAIDEQLGNLDDSMSRFIDTGDDLAVSQRNVYDGLTETSEQLEYAARVADDYTEAGVEMEFGADALAEAERKRAEALEESNRKTAEAEEQARKLAAEQERLTRQSGDLFMQYADATDDFKFFTHSLDTMGESFVMVGGRTAEQNESLSELQSEYDKVQDTIRSLTSGTEGLGLSQEELNESLAEQREQAAMLTEAMAPLQSIQGELQSVNNELAIDYEAVDAAMISAAGAAGASAEQIAVLKVATGDLSEEQAEQLLKQVAIQQSIEALGQAYAEGGLTLQEYISQARASVEEINTADFSLNLFEGTDTDQTSEQLAVVRDEALRVAEGMDETAESTTTFSGASEALTVNLEATKDATLVLDDASSALNEVMGTTVVTAGTLQGSYANLTSEMINMQQQAYGVNEAVGALPDEKVVTIRIETVGSVPRLPEGRAAGGPISAGQPYVVGELGPEVIIPGTNSYVVPNQSGNGFTWNGNMSVHSNSADPRAVAQAVPDKLLRAYRGLGSV